MGLRVLFALQAETGHVNPMIGTLQHLTERGHETAVFAYEDIGERLKNAGLSVQTYSVRARQRTSDRRSRTEDLTKRFRNAAWRQRWYEYNLLSSVSQQLGPLGEVVTAFSPDVVCIDPLVYAGAIVASQRDIPWAALSTNFVSLGPPSWAGAYAEAIERLAAARAALWQTHGVEGAFSGPDVVSPWLNMVFAVEAFAPRSLTGNDSMFYVGPPVPLARRGDEVAFPWERLADDIPIVYMSFGSGHQLSFDDGILRAAIEAVSGERVQLVMSLADRIDDPLLADAPANVIPVRYAPQRALLARAALMISHGGANSVNECLVHGTPMIVIPLAHEQPMSARLVERAGVGTFLEPAEVTPAALRHAIGRVLPERSTYRQRAYELAAACTSLDGSRSSADLIVELATSRAPVAGAPTGRL